MESGEHKAIALEELYGFKSPPPLAKEFGFTLQLQALAFRKFFAGVRHLYGVKGAREERYLRNQWS